MTFLAPLLPALGGAGAASAGGIASGILGVVGTAVSVAGSIASAAGAKAQADYQAQVAKNNAVIAKKNAEAASTQAQQQQVSQDDQTRALIGQQEALQAGSGLSVSGASQLRTRRTAAKLGDVDRTNIREEGQTNIMNYLQQSANFTSQASAAKAQGRGAILGGFLDATSSLISGASSVSNPSRITGAKSNKARNNLGGGFAGTYAGGYYG